MPPALPVRPLRAAIDGPGAFKDLFDVVTRPGLVAEAIAATTISATKAFALAHCRLESLRLARSPQACATGGLDLYAFVLHARAGADDLRIFDLSQPCGVDSLDPPGAHALTILFMPRSRVLRSFSNELALHGLSLSVSLPSISVFAAALSRFHAGADTMTSEDFEATASGLAEFAASVVNARLKAELGPALGAPLSTFLSVRRYIDQNLTARALNAERITETFGLSRATIYRLFEPAGGVAAYIRDARLARAHQEIAAPQNANKRTGHIAMRLGFPSANAFSRAFQERYGVSPTRARRIALEAIAEDREIVGLDEKGSIVRYLRLMQQ